MERPVGNVMFLAGLFVYTGRDPEGVSEEDARDLISLWQDMPAHCPAEIPQLFPSP